MENMPEAELTIELVKQTLLGGPKRYIRGDMKSEHETSGAFIGQNQKEVKKFTE